MLKKPLYLAFIFTLLIALIPLIPAAAQSTATVSGTLRHNGAPVEGVIGLVMWENGGAEFITGPDGMYLVSDVPTGSWIMIFVRPPVELRLAYRNWRTEMLSGDLVKDFDLQAGHRLTAQILMPDGTPPPEAFWLGMIGQTPPPESEWLGETVRPPNGYFEVVLPPDIYRLETPEQGRPNYALPDIAVDLTGGDVENLSITFEAYTGTETGSAIPTAPPRADLIQVSAPDSDGYATVSGAAGSVPANARVYVGNLNAHVFATANADASGAFALNLFAPPGSYLLVKYATGRFIELLQEFKAATGTGIPDGDQINELPGAMLVVSGTPLNGYTFNSAGAFLFGDLKGWAGWQFSGTLNGTPTATSIPVQRGQHMTLSGTLRVTSPALNCTGTPDYELVTHIHLQALFRTDGSAKANGIWFNSYLFTPTGLPIEHEGAEGDMIGVRSAPFSALTCVNEHTLEAALNTDFEIPPDLPDGIYQVTGHLPRPDNFPLADDMQQMVVWYAWDEAIQIPSVVIGSPDPPRIPWVLFGDYPVNGYRGVTAREDAGNYAMVTRVVTPPHQFIIPRLDTRTGQPITYQLEPGSPWLSQTDRRQPTRPRVPLALPSGTLAATIQQPDGSVETLGPVPIRQSSVRTPSTPGGDPIDHGTGHIGDMFHLATLDEAFAYQFSQDGHHVITLTGAVTDIYGRSYPINATYDVHIAQVLDLDPGQLPTTPYMQGDAFAPGLHIFPPVPAEVSIQVTHLPSSDPAQAITKLFSGRANRFGIFQPPPDEYFAFELPGEFRVDISASYMQADGRLWAGSMTWGSVVEGTTARVEAHGRRGMDYENGPIDDMPAWFEVFNLPENKIGVENYYPYFSGDIHWGNEDRAPGDSIHSIITVKDKTPDQMIYNLMRQYGVRATNEPRWPPQPFGDRVALLNQRFAIGEAPLSISTRTGRDPALYPDEIDLWGYWYGSSERPDVRVREIISEDGMGTAYWRFDDTYGYQIGESAEGDLPGDIKWEFGGAVFRVPELGINEYAIYSSLWVLLPHNDPIGARVTPPFQDATGASINGGPILTIGSADIDMLFLPKSIRPGDVLEVGDTIAFSGHVGPPLDSQVVLMIKSPGGTVYERTWHANKIGWLYDPSFSFVANEAGLWEVEAYVYHDRPYVGNGVIPMSHNSGTVLGTAGQFQFYVVPPDSPQLEIVSPTPGVITWAEGRVEPLTFQGIAPHGTTSVYYTIHDKGTVMMQRVAEPDSEGIFWITYDAPTLSATFPYLSLTAREGHWPGLADEVSINALAVGSDIRATTITLIGEQLYIGGVE
ncbi:MAG: carboxypeptidase regulatory-like domain-containing protein [Anaerolineae bacterium]|nr:carboxypeptidase regulatory-like domain-containing protein [Anaerolineae bacterium]